MGLGQGNRGYAMAALLVGMSVMAVLMSAAMPVWTQFAKREKEAELIWRGEQYARAVGLFQRKYANTFPPTVDILVEQRFLRKKYKDPVTGEDFQPIPAGGSVPPGVVRPPGSPQFTPDVQGRPGGAGQFGQGGGLAGQPPRQGQPVGPGQPSIGIQGVVSKSGDTALKIYNGRSKYNEWSFVYLATNQRIGPGGTQQPQGPQRPGQRDGAGFNPNGGLDRRPMINGQPQPFPGGSGGPPSGFGPPPAPSPFGPAGGPPGPRPRPPGT
ncbi:MAG: type II secretion system protein [Acidobacteria bacterium]|nr:type II secretion system protein [Acidobacteriota bacterium]